MQPCLQKRSKVMLRKQEVVNVGGRTFFFPRARNSFPVECMAGKPLLAPLWKLVASFRTVCSSINFIEMCALSLVLHLHVSDTVFAWKTYIFNGRVLNR